MVTCMRKTCSFYLWGCDGVYNKLWSYNHQFLFELIPWLKNLFFLRICDIRVNFCWADWRRKDKLKWPQRMTISMGIAKGVQFLHTGMVPGVFGNEINIENILLDESLTPKVSNYRIPLPYKVIMATLC